ncbi:hypothetical protein GCM10029992_32240 [Glycomyces albus]
MDCSGAAIVDGSGLSRADHCTAAFLTDLIIAAWQNQGPQASPSPNRPRLRPILQTLPVAGRTGTLRDRFAHAPGAIGAVRAKTGTLTGVASLCGVATGPRPIAFAIISGGVTDQTAARAALDEAAAAAVDFRSDTMTETAYLTGAGAYLPGEPVGNDQMAARLGGVDDRGDRLRRRVLASNGITTRHYALDAEGRTTELNEELAAKAIGAALDDRDLGPADLDMLATATTQGDLLVPGFASMVHGRLGGGPCTCSRPPECAPPASPRSTPQSPRSASANTAAPPWSAPNWPAAGCGARDWTAPKPTPRSCAGCSPTAPGPSSSSPGPAPTGHRSGSTGSGTCPWPTSIRCACGPGSATGSIRAPEPPGRTSTSRSLSPPA